MSELVGLQTPFFAFHFLPKTPRKNRLQPCQVLFLEILYITVAHAICDEPIKRKTPPGKTI
jgi:hypothetical protein